MMYLCQCLVEYWIHRKYSINKWINDSFPPRLLTKSFFRVNANSTFLKKSFTILLHRIRLCVLPMLDSSQALGIQNLRQTPCPQRLSVWICYTCTIDIMLFYFIFIYLFIQQLCGCLSNTEPVSPILLLTSNYHKDQRLNNSWTAFKIIIEKFFKSLSKINVRNQNHNVS